MNESPPSNAEQLASPSYRLAALDQDFLLSDAMRPVRFLLEFAKAETVLTEQAIVSTIVVFGSARTSEGEAGDRGRWTREARAFGRIASERGGALGGRDSGRRNVVATGGGPGVMGAANRGARDAGAPSIGLNITLPHEQEPNAWSTPSLTLRFHYFAMRKMHFAMRAAALVVFPGGFGTLDELFEILTLRQTGKAPPIPIVLMDRAFWTRLIDFDLLIEHGLIARADLDLFAFAETAEEAWSALIAGGLQTAPVTPA